MLCEPNMYVHPVHVIIIKIITEVLHNVSHINDDTRPTPDRQTGRQAGRQVGRQTDRQKI